MRNLIFAGTFAQAREYAQQQRLPVCGWSYISSTDMVMGLRNATVHFVGTWRDRADSWDMQQQARIRGFITKGI